MQPELALDWERIVDRYAERVYRVAYRILGSHHDAEDVSQTVFAEAVQVHRSGPVQSWTGLFVRLATLRAVDALRRRRKTSALPDDMRSSSNDPAELAAHAELAGWLRSATQRLPDQQAAVFTLTYYQQLGRDEVAAILSISPEGVSTALYQARQRLLAQLNIFHGDNK